MKRVVHLGKYIYAIFIVGLFVLSACTPRPATTTNNTTLMSEIIDIGEPTTPTGNVVKETEKETTKPEETKEETKTTMEEVVIPAEYKDITLKKTVTEGEKIELKPEAIDYDDDPITYSFSKPLSAQGIWQTKEGDAGFYPVDVTASDGKSKTTEKVLLIVLAQNRAPVLTCPKEIKVKEGETVKIDCTASDKENDDILITYSGFMTSSEKKTGYDDAGTKAVTVTASDGKKETKASVSIIIENSNRAPVITGIDDIEVLEGETVKVVAKASDPDNDKVTLTYSTPLDDKGEWKTKVGDGGLYDVTVTASDGKLTTKKTIKITVKRLNSAPVITKINDIVVEEGETVKLSPKVTDAEDDDVTITYSGWMTKDTKVTGYDDAGTYTVKVTASDGTDESSQNVKVTVNDKNRPPVFRVPI